MAQITFIPKWEIPVSIGDYRSIALLNSFIKIISKILTNRLAPLMGDLNADYQSGFIEVRTILEGVAITKEVGCHCQKNRYDGYLLKLDFQKVYDMVDWDCIEEVFRARGFGQRWLIWINKWLRSIKVQILIYGEAGKEIICIRGLRQGDPPSLLIFVLDADNLKRIFDKAKRAHLLEGLSGCLSISLTNLQYVE